MAIIRQEFQAGTGLSVSIGILRTKSDIPEEQWHILRILGRGMKLRDSGRVLTIAVGRWISDNRFYIVISRDSHYFGEMDVYGCGGYPGNGL